MKKHLLDSYNTRSGVDQLSSFIRTVKAFLLTTKRERTATTSPPVEADPGKFEEFMWHAVQ